MEYMEAQIQALWEGHEQARREAADYAARMLRSGHLPSIIQADLTAQFGLTFFEAQKTVTAVAMRQSS